jgi:DNA-directed RNA polymerase subunit RPC12/RpoP
VLVEQSSEIVRCPNCGSKDTRESHSHKFFDGFLRVFHRVPWRCRQCQKRFHISSADAYSAETGEEPNDKPQESGAE